MPTDTATPRRRLPSTSVLPKVRCRKACCYCTDASLIDRQGDASDKRLVRLALTECGMQLLKEIQLLPEWTQVVTRIAPQRNKIALAVLKELLLACNSSAGNRSFGVCNTCQLNLHEGPRSYRCGLTGEKLSLPIRA